MEQSSNNSSSMHPPFEMPWDIDLYTAVGFVIVPPNIASNILCCVVIAKTKSLHNFCNFLLVNLAISDMSAGLILFFVSTYTVFCSPLRKEETAVMMNVQLFIHPMIQVSILTVTVISVERFFAITQPFKVMRKGRTRNLKYIIPIVWILGFVLTIPVFVAFLGKSMEDVHGIQGSKELMADGIVYLVAAYIAPLSLMFFTYFRMLFVLKRRNQPFTSQLTISRSRANRRVWRLLGAVILSHNICFLPYAIVQFLMTQPFGFDMSEEKNNHAYYGTLFWQMLSPCLNPVIYFGHSSVFRNACRSIICRARKVKP